MKTTFDLPSYGGLTKKADFKSLNWQVDAKFISVTLIVKYFDAEGNWLDKIPSETVTLVATGSKYRNAEGERVETTINPETGVTVVPEGAISDYEFFVAYGNLGDTIMNLVEAQIQENVNVNKL